MLKTKGFTSIKEPYFIDLGSDEEYDHIYAICYRRIGVKAWMKVDFNETWQFATKYDESGILPKDGLQLNQVTFQCNYQKYKVYYLGKWYWYTNSGGRSSTESELCLTAMGIITGENTRKTTKLRRRSESHPGYNYEICFENGIWVYYHKVSNEVRIMRDVYKYPVTREEEEQWYDLFSEKARHSLYDLYKWKRTKTIIEYYKRFIKQNYGKSKDTKIHRQY